MNYSSAIAAGPNGVVGLWSFSPPHDGYYETGIIPEDFTPQFNFSVLGNAFQMGKAVAQVLYAPPIGQTFVFTEDGALYLYSTIGDEISPITQEPGLADFEYSELLGEYDRWFAEHVESVFQPGATRLAYVKGPSEVQIYDYQDHARVNNFAIPEVIGCLAYSVDGSLLVIGDHSDSGNLYLLDTQTYERVGIVPTGRLISSCQFGLEDSILVTGHPDGSILAWGI